MKELIDFSDFLAIGSKLEIKVGQIKVVEDVPKSNKLLKLIVDFGSESRIVVTNIKQLLSPENDPNVTNLRTGLGMSMSLVDKKFLFVTNLKPVTIMGIESFAMIMPGEIDKGLVNTVNGEVGLCIL